MCLLWVLLGLAAAVYLAIKFFGKSVLFPKFQSYMMDGFNKSVKAYKEDLFSKLTAEAEKMGKHQLKVKMKCYSAEILESHA